MIKIEIAKFIFRFKNEMLPSSFDNYFTNLNEIHKYNTRQKAKNGYHHRSFDSKFGRKQLSRESLRLWKSMISLAKKECSFSKFKKVFNDDILNY